jgi:hypothetical protein
MANFTDASNFVLIYNLNARGPRTEFIYIFLYSLWINDFELVLKRI